MNKKSQVQISGKDVETVKAIQQVLKRFQKKQVTLSETVEYTLRVLEKNFNSKVQNKTIQNLIVATGEISNKKNVREKKLQ
jgi:adenine deaminase